MFFWFWISTKIVVFLSCCSLLHGFIDVTGFPVPGYVIVTNKAKTTTTMTFQKKHRYTRQSLSFSLFASSSSSSSSSFPSLSSLPLPIVWSMSTSSSTESSSWRWKRLVIEYDDDDDTDHAAATATSLSETTTNDYISNPTTEAITTTPKEDDDDDEWAKKTRAGALETWKWCHQFVVQYQLCPWAKSSVTTPNALQLYMIKNYKNDDILLLDILLDVANRFQQFIIDYPEMESSAIFFCVFINDTTSRTNTSDDDDDDDFVNFCNEFFETIEPTVLHHTQDRIIAAPFHPDWRYNTNNDDNKNNDVIHDNDDDEDNDDIHCYHNNDVLDFEKQSPHPTISLVSADVVNRAGPEATDQIAMQNEEILNNKSFVEWQHLWREACRYNRTMPP